MDEQKVVSSVIEKVQPYDAVEVEHKNDALQWVNSGAQLFRIRKPDIPPKHLVAYFTLYDAKSQSFLIVDHINSGLRLPAGGHVDPGELPYDCAVREAYEELGVVAKITSQFGDRPQFISVTQTIGQGSHIDVVLWYVFAGDPEVHYVYEKREMNGYQWLSIPEILSTPLQDLDPCMHRFAVKMQNIIEKSRG